MWRTTAPVRSASWYQGTRFEWCSISVSRISSPARTLASPQLRATRLIEWVVPEVKMTCSVVAGLSPSGGSLGALMKARTFSRAASYKLVDLFGERVDAAMDVGVMVLVGVDNRVDHLPRPLAGGGVVEIHQRHAVVDRAGENGKIGPKPRGVEAFRLTRLGDDGHEAFSARVAPAEPVPASGWWTVPSPLTGE